MTTVIAKLLDEDSFFEFNRNKFKDDFDKTAFVRGENFSRYSNTVTLEISATGEDAAEEVFDISNNPARDEERREKWGRNRSLSVGDIVEVLDGDAKTVYLCDSFGWVELV